MGDAPHHQFRAPGQGRCHVSRGRGQGDSAGPGAQRCLPPLRDLPRPCPHHRRPPARGQKYPYGQRRAAAGLRRAGGPRRVTVPSGASAGGGQARSAWVSVPTQFRASPVKAPSLRKQQALGHRRPQNRARGCPRIGIQAARQVQRQHRRLLGIYPLKAVGQGPRTGRAARTQEAIDHQVEGRRIKLIEGAKATPAASA